MKLPPRILELIAVAAELHRGLPDSTRQAWIGAIVERYAAEDKAAGRPKGTDADWLAWHDELCRQVEPNARARARLIAKDAPAWLRPKINPKPSELQLDALVQRINRARAKIFSKPQK